MTTGTAGRPSKGLLGDAAAAAANAARRAAVTIRPLETLGDMERACAVLNAVWGIGPDEVSEVQPHLLRALGHAGNYLVGAYAAGGGDRMVGASVGFFAEPLGAAMHSHITGVLPARAGSGVGAAIKWHQRQWALERGLTRIGWTFDPLIARNSFFNLTRLGARAETYFVDFYGAMNDGPNRGQPTDRIQVVWDLAAVDVLDAQQSVIDETPGSARPGDRGRHPCAARAGRGRCAGAGDGPPAGGSAGRDRHPGRHRGDAAVGARARAALAVRPARGARPLSGGPVLARRRIHPDRLVSVAAQRFRRGRRHPGGGRGGTPMKITGVELRTIRMPLVSPFETSFGVERERSAVLVRVVGRQHPPDDGAPVEVQGWGECVAMGLPLYSSEYTGGALDVLRRFLVPRLFERGGEHDVTAENVEDALAPIVGHRMAKAALEMAVLDAQLRGTGQSLAEYLGATSDVVPSGVSVGIQPTISALLDAVGDYLAQGYVRIKLKIKPGWDVAPVEAVRERFGERCRCRSTRTPRTRWPMPPSSPGSTPSACCSSSSRWPRTTCDSTPSWRRCSARRSVSTSRSRPSGRPPTRSPSGRAG